MEEEEEEEADLRSRTLQQVGVVHDLGHGNDLGIHAAKLVSWAAMADQVENLWNGKIDF